MSRPGKFIPGGSGKVTRTGPIRAPEPGALPSDPSAGAGARKPFGKGSLVKPVTKGQRLPIVIMSAIVCCLLVSVAWYNLAYAPTLHQLADARRQIDAANAVAQKIKDDAKKAREEALKQQAAVRGTLTVDSNPTGATVTIGDFRKTTPAHFADMIPGTFSIVIHADGYEDYKQDVTVTADKPTDLGMIELVQKTGNLSLSSEQTGVTYKLTGSGNYTHEGQLPDKIEKLPVGDYLITASQHDWKLPPLAITIHDHETVEKEIKFPYASASILSSPPGATV